MDPYYRIKLEADKQEIKGKECPKGGLNPAWGDINEDKHKFYFDESKDPPESDILIGIYNDREFLCGTIITLSEVTALREPTWFDTKTKSGRKSGSICLCSKYTRPYTA